MNENEKLNSILIAISNTNYSEEDTENLKMAFDTSECDKLLTFIKFLSSHDFNGKISLAAYKKLLDKHKIDTTSIDVYKRKSKTTTREFSKMIASIDNVRRRGVSKKGSFKQLMHLSKMKRKMLYNPQMYSVPKSKLHDLITKIFILEIFNAWKAKKYITSSIVDNLTYKSFAKRYLPTYKSALKKFLEKSFNEHGYDNFIIKSAGLGNCYFGSYALPNISFNIDVGYNLTNHGSYVNAAAYMISLSSSRIPATGQNRFSLFDLLYIKNFLSYNLMFSVTVNYLDRYASNWRWNSDIAFDKVTACLQLNNDRFLQSNVPMYNSVNDSNLSCLELYKDTFDSTQERLNNIYSDFDRNINDITAFYQTQISNVNFVSFFKFLDTFCTFALQNILFISSTTVHTTNTINCIFFSFIKNISFTIGLEEVYRDMRISLNNPFLMFMFMSNNGLYLLNSRDCPLNISLYLGSSNQNDIIFDIVQRFKVLAESPIHEKADEYFYNGSSSWASVTIAYKKFLSLLAPELTETFDLEDKLLFFRHFSEFMANPISMIDDSFDVNRYLLIEKALEKFDGEKNV